MALQFIGFRSEVDYYDLRPGQWVQHRWRGAPAISLVVGATKEKTAGFVVFAAVGEDDAPCHFIGRDKAEAPFLAIETPLRVVPGLLPYAKAFSPELKMITDVGGLVVAKDGKWVMAEDHLGSPFWANLETGEMLALSVLAAAKGHRDWSLWLPGDTPTAEPSLIAQVTKRVKAVAG